MSQVTKDDKTGIETLNMRFLVQGKKAEGWVSLQMERLPGQLEFDYVLLALDVQGHQRVYLEGGRTSTGKRGNRMLGIKLW